MEKILELKNIHKNFRLGEDDIEVLDGIEISIEQGETFAIVGPSGSGKTTLLQIIGLLDSPTRGELYVRGESSEDLNDKSKSRLRNEFFGFIYQFHHLMNEFTALENTMMPLLIRNQTTKEASAKAQDLLIRIGLEHRVNHKPHELSGGECQRVAVARALVTSPSLILADEPTGNLDPETADRVFDSFLDLNRSLNTSLIMVTHNQELAKRMDKVYELNFGKLIPSSPDN
ncbi:MAG: ABC transporter ATP-binding protein [Gammaproteobacteria bacterium]|jgi:lipoprotein-releasing system ATP-binding protein|nr:ABC transporter ATP-binding protein [Gammaproteobacteria bacterium]GIS86003.1 MAG: lipoprotein-releasing system ATP-binding protein LolD [Woeseia sp.]|tara:strand:- start:1603 stop:2292 length:690 start_codon:yes stop_codon:yes gene_type:complete